VTDAVAVDALTAGDHACVTFTDVEERLDIVAAFVADGLDQGVRVLCFTDSVAPERLAEELAMREVAVAAATDAGRLRISGGDRAWLGGAGIDAAGMVTALADEVEQAVDGGFAGLRVAADMCWAVRPVAGVEELAAFEANVADLFTGGRLTAICQYDREDFDPVTLAFAAQTHPKTVAALAYRDDPVLRVCRQHRPPGVRIAGELDHGDLEPLEQALGEALRLDHDIRVNLVKVRFLDLTAATMILKTALSLPAGRCMTVTCSGQVADTFDLIGADIVAQLRVERVS